MKTRFRIHPAIGVARMGNSSDHFVGAETPGVPGNWDDDRGQFRSFRDGSGRILRQGARFRVYQYDEDANGQLSNPREVSPGKDIVDIEWRVHLANRKASFFVFDGQNGAKDLYLGRSQAEPTLRIKTDPDRDNLRNSGVPAADRARLLEIDPGEQVISQAKTDSVELENPNKNIPIESLGTLLLDDTGRLIVLGGYGESNSTETPPRQIDEYASNDTWFDDASDGSVKARVKLKDGTVIDADAAWVIVGPPDFAPGVGNVITLFDTVWDTAVREVVPQGPLPLTRDLPALSAQKAAWARSGSLDGYNPSFANEIYPLLMRALGARDVHQSGTGRQNYHLRTLGADVVALLSDPSSQQGGELRKYVFGFMRDPDGAVAQWDKMPRGLGDEAYPDLDGNPSAVGPRAFVSLPRTQFALLREWAKNNFIPDWQGTAPVPKSNPSPSPEDLDRAALENCVGGPFFPGIEISWLIRTKELFSEPFRLKVPMKPDEELAAADIPKVGALEFRAGFFSQQMALPWQADFYDCHKELHQSPDKKDYVFMWWTAQRPDDTFPSGQTAQQPWVRTFYEAAEDPDDIEEFEDADPNRFTQMQKRWAELKFVSVKTGDRFEEEP